MTRRPAAMWIRAAGIVLLGGMAIAGGAAGAADSIPTTPYPGPARSIGGAANGCLAGAQALPLSGPGWEVMRPLRNRFWGNPALVAFLEDMARRTASLGRLLVLDMAQPRGGHMTSSHGSHQTGVDADLLYRLASGPLSDEERSAPAMDSMVTAAGGLDPVRWSASQTALVKTFASDPRVERIFVNPAIKRALCGLVTGDRQWLRKLRPWWGHDEHFHVRIACPPGDRDCIAGPPIPAGEGCGDDLAWWFTADAAVPKPSGKPRPPPPEACKAVLQGE